ncbi:hypothetical protein P0L94_10425 [Microbacter sp. GSS18]|nr:hypothetical protein P0L94_10425 [Microbacter sp. GSS18]
MPPDDAQTPIILDVVRPADLLQFRVEFRGCERRRGVPTEPVWAMAVTDHSRMIVHFSFQHAHEEAVYDGPPKTVIPDPDDPTKTLKPSATTASHDLPVGFAPARASRLVFEIPENDGAQLSTEGILAAIQKFPLALADRARPDAPEPEDDPADLGIAFLLSVDLKVLIHANRIVLAEPDAAEKRIVIARDAASPAIRNQILAAVRREAARKPIVARERDERLLEHLRGFGLSGSRIRPPDLRRLNDFSAPPADDETAIEAPYRLIISPNAHAGWAHAAGPVRSAADSEHVELWHTRLSYRRRDGSLDEHPGYMRVVRALWARDRDGLGNAWKASDADRPPGPLSTPSSTNERPFKGSLTRADRHQIVRQTAETWSVGGDRIEPRPVRADRLHLSALGAWLDFHGTWETLGYSGLSHPHLPANQRLQSILKWDHIAPQGRDQFVRVMYPGYLYPLGHRATLVKITERKIRGTGTNAFTKPAAALYQRMFIVLGDVRRDYGLSDLPFTSVALAPIVTPTLDDPQNGPADESIDTWFWPRLGGVPFVFSWDTTDRIHAHGKTRAPLMWVRESFGQFTSLDGIYDKASERILPFDGQDVDFAPPTAGGDAKLQTQAILLRGEATAGTSTPRMSSARVVLPAAQRLTGLGAVPITYEAHFRDGTQDPAVGVWGAIVTNDIVNDGASYGKHVLHAFGQPGPADDDALADTPVLAFGKTPPVPGLPAQPELNGEVGSDRGGGFLQPNLPLRALSTEQGPVGDLAQATAAVFDPAKALKGALPRLFGLVSIADLIPDSAFENAPSVITKSLDALQQLVTDIAEMRDRVQKLADAANGAGPAQDAKVLLDQLDAELTQLTSDFDPVHLVTMLGQLRAAADKLRQALPAATPFVRSRLETLIAAIDTALAAEPMLDVLKALRDAIPVAGKDMTFRYDWEPELAAWPQGGPIITFADDHPHFTIAIEGRIPAGGGTPRFEVLAELLGFTLDLLPGARLLKVPFEHMSFRASATGKTEVDVVLGDLEFQGALSFINDIKDLIPLDGFSDPPFMEVSTEGVKAGFSLALPNLAIGVFSLSNISLGADVHVPFLGEIVTVGFNFCTREKPFVLSVCFLGGGGFFALRLSPERVEILELSLEAGAYLSVDFGVASGSISAAIGVYMRMQDDNGLISGFVRLRGEVDVLGLISASIEMLMALDYYPQTGKVIGRASITVKVEVLFFSATVRIEAERQFAGSNGDPTFRDVYLEPGGTHLAWDRYLDAFAPEEVPA